MLHNVRKITYVLILIITACSNPPGSISNEMNGKFDLYLKSMLGRFDLQERIVFDELYGLEKARERAQIYCQNLHNGQNKLQQLYKYGDFLEEKVQKGMITQEERHAMKSVRLAIYSVAQLTYCLENSGNKHLPLNERLEDT